MKTSLPDVGDMVRLSDEFIHLNLDPYIVADAALIDLLMENDVEVIEIRRMSAHNDRYHCKVQTNFGADFLNLINPLFSGEVSFVATIDPNGFLEGNFDGIRMFMPLPEKEDISAYCSCSDTSAVRNVFIGPGAGSYKYCGKCKKERL